MKRTKKLKNINPGETSEWVNFGSEELEKIVKDMIGKRLLEMGA